MFFMTASHRVRETGHRTRRKQSNVRGQQTAAEVKADEQDAVKFMREDEHVKWSMVQLQNHGEVPIISLGEMLPKSIEANPSSAPKAICPLPKKQDGPALNLKLSGTSPHKKQDCPALNQEPSASLSTPKASLLEEFWNISLGRRRRINY